jgi:hypothetical protein
MRRAVVFASVMGLVLSGSGARASDSGAGCGTATGKTYTNSATCHLTFRGFPITVFADAQVSSGDARVHVWATLRDLDGTPVIVVECTDEAPGYASCGTGFPTQTDPIDHNLLSQFSLQCHVQGRGTGAYRCVSGRGN